MFPPLGLLGSDPEATRAFLAEAGRAGVDHVCCGDHVSFAGVGFDGLVQATTLLMLHPTLPVYTGVYLLRSAIPSWSPASLPTWPGSPPAGSFSASASAARTATRSPSAG
jgi:hypothetical protein